MYLCVTRDARNNHFQNFGAFNRGNCVNPTNGTVQIFTRSNVSVKRWTFPSPGRHRRGCWPSCRRCRSRRRPEERRRPSRCRRRSRRCRRRLGFRKKLIQRKTLGNSMTYSPLSPSSLVDTKFLCSVN